MPFLLLDEDLTISETSVIIQYLAENKPESALAPKLGTFERVRLDEWLNFIATEVHKSFYPFFAGMDDNAKNLYLKKLGRHFTYIASKLQTRRFLTGKYTIADVYLYTLLTWTTSVKIDISA